MEIEKAIRDVILPLCPRVFYDFAPVETQRPYVTFQQIGGMAPVYVEGTLPDAKNGEFQINVWANKRLEASALMLQIESALVAAAGFQAKPLGGAVSDADPDVPVYGSRQDFTVWSTR